MPKKFKGENSKAAEARARKEAQKNELDQRKKQQLEDEYWKDDDKHVVKKLQRKEEKDKKKTEQLEKKKELQKILDEEMASLAKIAGKPVPVPKITRADIEAHQQTIAAADKAAAAAKNKPKLLEEEEEEPIEENINRIMIDGDHAQTVDEAINLLSGTDQEVDSHPEKRMKAAYLAFEEKNLPRLKEENPNLRLSQLKQILKKDWTKSSENPLNQRLKAVDN